MPDRLLIDSIEVSGELESALRLVNQIKIVNRLSNGQPNVQIIGSPSTKYGIHYFAYLAGRDSLDEACYSGTEMVLEYHGVTYTGIIEETELPWMGFITDEGNEVFEVEFILLVLEL